MDLKTSANVEIARNYIDLLEKGDIRGVISLFSSTGIVHSPIYGKKSAKEFYNDLAEDTSESKLTINGIFEEPGSNRVALYFNYTWTLKNGEVVNFDVVDIIVFDDDNNIVNLKIIYDTRYSRKAIGLL
jgi:hypothetical protein